MKGSRRATNGPTQAKIELISAKNHGFGPKFGKKWLGNRVLAPPPPPLGRIVCQIQVAFLGGNPPTGENKS